MTDKLAWIDKALQELREKNLYTTIRTIESPQGAWLQVDGRRVLNFCSNNYLGLANDPRLVQAAKEACDRQGVGPAAVRTIAGTLQLHVDLEKRLAEFKEAEAAILFQSGFSANLPDKDDSGIIIGPNIGSILKNRTVAGTCKSCGIRMSAYFWFSTDVPSQRFGQQDNSNLFPNPLKYSAIMCGRFVST